MGDYQKLRVWSEAIDLAVQCYEATDGFPATEKFGLTSQIRRASVSVSANIAEGSGRKTDRDFARFVRMAGASANEVESLLHVAHKLGFLTTPSLDSLGQGVVSVRRQLTSLERRLISDGKGPVTGDR